LDRISQRIAQPESRESGVHLGHINRDRRLDISRPRVIKILIDLRTLTPRRTALSTPSAAAAAPTTLASAALVAPTRRSAGVAGPLPAGLITTTARSARFAACWS
jgi:hypothetical protein